MKNTLSEFSLLLQPSLRSIAYLRVFVNLGLAPASVILLQGTIGKMDELKTQDSAFGYSARFFDIDPDILASLHQICPVVTVASSDVNSHAVRQAITDCPGRYLVFSASGILGREAFTLGKKFIHVHPGLLPHYRGSTCFYYSLLEQGFVGSTAFFMNEGIDTGEVIAASRFSVNYDVKQAESLFIDLILDPYIRSVTLKKVLSAYLNHGVIAAHPQAESKRPAYYVIDPVLRRLATDLLAKSYDPSLPQGVFDTEPAVT